MHSKLVATDSIRAVRRRGDRMMTAVCGAFWCCSFGFVFLHGSWISWAVCGTFLAVLPLLLNWLIPGTRGSRIGISLCLAGFAALMVHQSHGVIETHFAFFIVLPLLLYYRDWRPILCAAFAIAVEHLVACWLQMHGYPVYIFPPDHNMAMVVVHAAYVVVEAALLIYLTLQIRLEALESSAIAAFGERISTSGKLDLAFDSERHRGSAARGLTKLLGALAGVTRNSGALALRVNTLSQQIASSSDRMLKLSEAQAASGSQAFHAVESMSQASTRIKEDCAAVAQVANQSATIVSEGCSTIQQTADLMLTVSATVSRTVAEITQLQAESARIESIVRIMNDISTQSGLLALNASIEAARAGEKGKGFQVVAQEIRTLSDRSYESLAEVQSIVDTIGRHVGQLKDHANQCQNAATLGGSQVKAAFSALNEVAQHLPRVAERVGRVISTADHHALTSADVLSGMTRIEQSVQQNATEMKSLAALSHSLEAMSQELSANVSQFQQAPALPANAPRTAAA